MKYLHKDRELFSDVILASAAYQNRPVAIVEKDYYVTMILKLLSERAPSCVFKGGTSLSKCYHVIDRFSEDIDITCSEDLTQGQRKKLKNNIILGISEELELPISNWDDTRSRRDYNCYYFDYEPVGSIIESSLRQGVKMEVVLGSISFPTEKLPVDSYVYQYLSIGNRDIVEQYNLMPFDMMLQSLERTFVDKIFAICDYYLEGRVKRHSRHLYDLYMLLPKITFDNNFKELVARVRRQRAKMSICPSAYPEINIPKLLEEIVENDTYRDDYAAITGYFQRYPIDYETVIKALESIKNSGMF